MKHYFNHYHIAEALEPRYALYGGRTNAAKLYHCCARSLSSRASASQSRQIDVCLVQNVRRYRQLNSLFKEYINTFAKIKLEASGYPKNCVMDEQKQWYINDILENQGIQLDPAEINYNPGLRPLAKLMLNSFWGKFVQRSNLVKTEQIDDPQVFFDCLTSDEITVLNADLVSNEILGIRYEYRDKFVQPDPNTNVVIVAFTTAHAFCNCTTSSTRYVRVIILAI